MSQAYQKKVKGINGMKLIQGKQLQVCKQAEKTVYDVLKTSGIVGVSKRFITWEWTNAKTYGGITYLTRKQPRKALIRLSTNYTLDDMNTIYHELIHAYLPLEEAHGNKFKKAMQTLNEHGMHVTMHVEEKNCKPIRFKYLFTFTKEGEKVKVLKYNRYPKWRKWYQLFDEVPFKNGFWTFTKEEQLY